MPSANAPSIPDTSWVYNSDVECYNYNAETAKAEFAKSGYTFDESTQTMMTPDGQPLVVEVDLWPQHQQDLGTDGALRSRQPG